MFFWQIDLGTLDLGERSLPFGLLVFLCQQMDTFLRKSGYCETYISLAANSKIDF